MGIASWQMALPLVVMGLGMGLIVAPLTDAVLSEVPKEHSGSASGLINTVQQMGNALGLGLVSVVFFGSIGDDLVPPQLNQAFVDGFQHSLWYVAGVLAVIFLVMFALPARPQQHVEGAVDEAGLLDLTKERAAGRLSPGFRTARDGPAGSSDPRGRRAAGRDPRQPGPVCARAGARNVYVREATDGVTWRA